MMSEFWRGYWFGTCLQISLLVLQMLWKSYKEERTKLMGMVVEVMELLS